MSNERKYRLHKNYDTLVIEYSLEKDSQVQIKVFNSSGSMVADLVNGKQKAGYRSVEFDASKLSSGIYYYTLIVDSKNIATKKMLMLK